MYIYIHTSSSAAVRWLSEGPMAQVPDGWYHAVLNLADTVAVTMAAMALQILGNSGIAHIEHV